MNLKRAADIDRLVANPPSSLKAALFHGRDRSSVTERARALAASAGVDLQDPFNSATLSDVEVERDAGRLTDELSALALFGARRVVSVQLFAERNSAERLVASALQAHLAGELNPDCLLLISAGALGGGSPLRKAAEAGGDHVAVAAIYDDSDADIGKLIRDILARDGLRLSSDALGVISARLPKDRGVARSEIERLALFVGPGASNTVSLEELRPFFGVEADASLTEAAEHAFGGRLGPALENLRRAFNEGEAGVAAVRAAGLHAQRLRRIGFQTRSGASIGTALKASGVFWKNEREMTRQSRAWSDDELATAQGRVLETETLCKAAGAPDLLLAERLLLTIASAARRAGL